MDDAPQAPGRTATTLIDAPSDDAARGVIQRMLRGIREHLDLDIAFVGEIVDGRRVFRFVDSETATDVVTVGASDPLEESYCHHVLEGRIPAFLADPSQHPVAANLRITRQLPVGAHLSVPITFSDGRVYGTLCCFAFTSKPALHPRDVQALRLMAAVTADYLEAVDSARQRVRDRTRQVRRAVDDAGALKVVFQPLCDLATMEVVAVEALSRFPAEQMSPQCLFAEAAAVGLGVDLEMRAVASALAHLGDIPPPIRLNINVSPETLYSARFIDVIKMVEPERVVVEVTEHAAIEDYTQLQDASTQLKNQGVRLAIDDVGMGFSGLNRILETQPDELKLDAAVIRDVHQQPAKYALVEAFVSFGHRTGIGVVAEGIETPQELDVLRRIGVEIGQGYLLGRPGALSDALTPPSSSSGRAAT